MADINDGGGNNAGGNAGERPVWMDSLPDAHKQNQAFYGFKEPAQAWDKFDTLLKADGKAVVIPDENASEAERTAFYTRLGVPEKPEGYEFDKDDIEEAADKMFRDVMLNSRIGKREAKGVRKAFVDMLTRGREAQARAETDRQAAEQKALDDAVNSLKDTWKGDEFKVRTEKAQRAFQKFAGDEGTKFINETKVGGLALGDHPVFLKLFASIADAIGDDNMADAGRGSSGGGQKSDEDRARQRFPNTQFAT